MPKRFGVSLSMSALLSIRRDRSFKSSSRPARLILAVLGGFVLLELWLFVIARAESSAQAALTFQPCNAGPAVIARTHSSTGTPPNDVITAASDPLCIKTDLRVAKTVNTATPQVGEAITYTVVVINAGPDDATGVQLTDVLPTGVTFGSAAPQNACIEEDNTITCDLGHLPNGDSAIVTIVVTPTKVGTITNVASVTGNESDPDPGNNTAEKSVGVVGADLVVTKTVNITAPNVGDVITYTITVANNGPDEATGVQVIDVLPAGVSFGGYTATWGTYISATGLWNVDDLANAESATMTMAATVISCTGYPTIPNTASISAGRPDDPNPGNNESRVVITPTSGMHCLYLPIIFKDYVSPICNPYFDDFSDDSRWPKFEDDVVELRYEGSKYLVHLKKPSRVIVEAPTSKSNNTYTITISSRWNYTDSAGSEYGINFGHVSLPSGEFPYKSYLFVVDARNQRYRLMYKPDATINRECIIKENVPISDCWKSDKNNIRGGTKDPTAKNELTVVCTPYQIKIYANGAELWKTDNPKYSCAGGLGIEAQEALELHCKAIFNKFEVSCSASVNTFGTAQKVIGEQSTVTLIEPPGE
jgi:uncharacterized repeat protein (TIGR01451 family)